MSSHHDFAADPALTVDLLHTQCGTAYFERKLDELTDAELDGPSRLPGWTRRHVIAHVGYNARALARLARWARTGVEHAMYPSAAARNEEIEVGSTADPAALRELVEDSAGRLAAAWQSLTEGDWGAPVRTNRGRVIPAADTIWMRCREVWVHAVDLDNGASFVDVPAPVTSRLVTEIVSSFSDVPGLGRVEATDAALDLPAGDGSGVLSGSLASLAGWATGRGSAAGLRFTGGAVPPAPPWL